MTPSIRRAYTTRVLPRAFGRGLAQLLRGPPSGALQSAAIVAGLVCHRHWLRSRRDQRHHQCAAAKTLVSAQLDAA